MQHIFVCLEKLIAQCAKFMTNGDLCFPNQGHSNILVYGKFVTNDGDLSFVR